MSSGIACPKCGHSSTVVRSEQTPSGKGRMRVRRCRECGHLFTTTEAVDSK